MDSTRNLIGISYQRLETDRPLLAYGQSVYECALDESLGTNLVFDTKGISFISHLYLLVLIHMGDVQTLFERRHQTLPRMEHPQQQASNLLERRPTLYLPKEWYSIHSKYVCQGNMVDQPRSTVIVPSDRCTHAIIISDLTSGMVSWIFPLCI